MFFERAKQEAYLSDFKIKKLGCIAVYKNKIIGYGHNSEKTHPLQMKYNKYRHFDCDFEEVKHKIHAEVECLSHLEKNIQHLGYSYSPNKIKLYIYRVCISRDKGMAYPCSACMALIKDFGIKHIYFTTDYGYAYQLLD